MNRFTLFTVVFMQAFVWSLQWILLLCPLSSLRPSGMYLHLILSKETETEIPDKDIRFRFRRLLYHLKKHQSFFKLLEKNDLSWMIHYCAMDLSKNYIHKYQPAAVAYEKKLKALGLKVYRHYIIPGYPSNIPFIVSNHFKFLW